MINITIIIRILYPLKASVMKIYKETNYCVYPNGVIKNIKTGRIMKVHEVKGGYISVGLNGVNNFLNGKKKFAVHRLVAELYIPNPDNKKEVNHMNGIKNDNRVENLEWVTPKENQAHSYLTGIAKSGCDHKRASLNREQVNKARELYLANHKLKDIAIAVGSNYHVIKDVIKNRSYKKEYGW